MTADFETYAKPAFAAEKMQLELTRLSKAGSPSERRIAKHLMRNATDLNGETAATLAEKLKLSPMTVGRFLRGLGFQELGELTTAIASQENGVLALGQPDWIEAEAGNPAMNVYLRQVKAVQAGFKLTTQPIWNDVLETMANANRIFITSGEQIFGTTLHFYSRVAEYLEGVSYLHASRAHLQLADTLAEESVLVIIDANDASDVLLRLSQLAQTAGMRVIVLTTNPSLWQNAGQATILHPETETPSGEFEPVLLSCMLEMMFNGLSQFNVRGNQRAEKIAKFKSGLTS